MAFSVTGPQIILYTQRVYKRTIGRNTTVIQKAINIVISLEVESQSVRLELGEVEEINKKGNKPKPSVSRTPMIPIEFA